ncbi:MAG: HTTM domain-containing protein, partial [Rhodothermales bacterium]
MRKLVTSQTSIAPLAVFRALFGAVMLASIVRFAAKGWIGELYVEPTYFFSYYGFEWVAAPGEAGMYALFLVMALAAAGIMLGRHYRMAAVVFFLTFTYVELIDKTNYLNHYYFVSIISFLLIWVPANRHFSLDVRKRPELKVDTVPAWTVNIFKLQLGLVYFFAGLAKLHPEWLLDAMPLALWLPAHAHLPIVGGLLEEPLTAYALSWAGATYDLTIVFFLMWSRTRAAAYTAVVVFHLTTALLFQIGMFPYIMILCTLIFFPAAFHERVIGWMQ